MKNKKIPWFALVLSLSIFVLSFLATKITSRIVITTINQRIELTNAFEDRLQDNAIFRARTLDPEAVWLETDEEVDEIIRAYIEENLASLVRLNGDQMSKDSNLAWIIEYNNQEYKHNWKDSYEQQTGAIDYTIRSHDGKVTYSGAIQPNVAFQRNLTILVNPSIVPEERLNSTKGSEYAYRLTLPDGFSIRYYVPSVIQSNGGTIAHTACQMGTTHWPFCVIASSALLMILVLFWPWKQEKDLTLLVRFGKIKGLFAVLLLGGAIAGMLMTLNSLSMMNSDGALALMFQSFGMTLPQATLGAMGVCIVMWGLFLSFVALATLYGKSIFKMGIWHYLTHDTVTASLFQIGQNEILEAFTGQRTSRAGLRLILISLIVTLAFSALLVLGLIFLGPVGLTGGFFFGTILLAIFFWSLFKHMNQSFAKVYEASEELAKGNFSALPPQNIGYYQPLYDELVHISDSYQTALKEGLASQVSKTQLISNVSHDLKTPVAGIQSYSELITLSDNMDDIHGYAKRLNQYAIRLNDLIVDLFDVAKATSGDIKLELVDIDLSELVMQVSAEWDDVFEDKGLKTVMNLQPHAMLRLDPGKMVRVMENLLSNISKYSLPNSRVFIDLFAKDGLYQLILKNTSNTEMNFNPENIVERFVRGDASRHEAGSGLGLAIVKSFVEVQQGTFEVQTDGDLFKACISFAIPPTNDPDHPNIPPLPQTPRSLPTPILDKPVESSSVGPKEDGEIPPTFEQEPKSETSSSSSSRIDWASPEEIAGIQFEIPKNLPAFPDSEKEEKVKEENEKNFTGLQESELSIENQETNESSEDDLLFQLSTLSASTAPIEDQLWDLSQLTFPPTPQENEELEEEWFPEKI